MNKKNFPAVVEMEESNLLIFTTKEGKIKIEPRLQNNTLWLTQKQMAELYQVSIPTINRHLKGIYEDNELQEVATITRNVIVASSGKKYTNLFYSLEAILHVGYRVRSNMGTLFRAWATQRLQEYLVKGFTLNDEQLKGTNGYDVYFEELLERVREIRTSEKKFYQKVRELIAQTSTDYNARKNEQSVKNFFTTLQNKMLYAITRQTAAELIRERVNANLPNMGLTSISGSFVKRSDVTISKNYLYENELQALNRLVDMFLTYAEDRAIRKKSITLDEWQEQTNRFLEFNERSALKGHGKVKKEIADSLAFAEFNKYKERIKLEELTQAEKEDNEEFENIVKDLM